MGNYDVEGTPAAGYRIAVSNDKARHSQFLELITFDSVCQECNISHGCLLKVYSVVSLPFSKAPYISHDWHLMKAKEILKS